ncbi:DUF4192 family protein [Nonomuraea polychroma]|uniref:DUF4192 family protein n=1 Tax=Nonomuraea polychroma TaxID=46176 RepID=UPI003D92B45F
MDSPDNFHTSTHAAGELAALLPHLLGYTPDNQLLVILTQGPTCLSALPVTLPPAHPDWATHLHGAVLAGARLRQADGFSLVGYGASHLVTPAMDKLTPLLAAHLHPRGMLRIHGNRYHLHGCLPGCTCPPDGTPIPAVPPEANAAHQRNRAQRTSDDTTPAHLQPAVGRDRHIGDYYALLASLSVLAEQSAHPDNLFDNAARRIADAVTAYRADDQLDHMSAARAALAVHLPLVCRQALARIGAAATTGDRRELHAHTALWLDVTRRAHRHLVTPPALLCAAAAHLLGDHDQAANAIHYALRNEHRRGNKLAHLVHDAIHERLPDTTFLSMITVPLAELNEQHTAHDPEPGVDLYIAVVTVCSSFSNTDQLTAARLVPTFTSSIREIPPATHRRTSRAPR